MKKPVNGLTAFCVLTLASPLFAQDDRALSTSNMISIPYIELGAPAKRIDVCSKDQAVFSRSYVSIEITKLRVAKEDGWVKRLFNNNRRAFAASTFRAQGVSGSISVSKVGTPRVLSGRMAHADLGSTWNILSKIPWTIRDANLSIRIGYAADSTIDAVVNTFNAISSTIPDYTVSTSVSVGIAITSALDSMLFGQERVTSLLRSERDFPLAAGGLCEGYYAVFAAENADKYDRYENGEVVFDENSQDLIFEGSDIADISYAVVLVAVDSSYYQDASDAINDPGKVWAAKYREVQSGVEELVFLSEPSAINTLVSAIRTTLREARTLLDADLSIVQSERRSIHRIYAEELQRQIEAVRARIGESGEVSEETTLNAMSEFSRIGRESEIEFENVQIDGFLSSEDQFELALSEQDAIRLGEALNRAAASIEAIL